MSHFPTDEYKAIVNELRKLPSETEWVEFKSNRAVGDSIGEYISALSNSATLCHQNVAYMIWGIDDKTHEIIGTTFQPKAAKHGNENLENWISHLLSPAVNFYFIELVIDGKRIVLLEIDPASNRPVSFINQEFIRVGSYKKPLKDHPEKERELWKIFENTPFESRAVMTNCSDENVLTLLDYPAFFELLKMPLPDGRANILYYLEQDRLISKNIAGTWDILALGAILFAKKLSNFERVKRKAVRIIQYEGKGKIKTLREEMFDMGYAASFELLTKYIMTLLPANEVIEQSFRKSVPMFPDLAIRELLANALIHQDFFSSGTGPMIELFEDRIEISNPGVPLVSIARFLDSPPRSRNESIASLMRRFGICEERGSGIDKVVFVTEFYQLPAPLFEQVEDSATRVTLFAHKNFKDMDKADKLRACYLHACLQYVKKEPMTNSTVRARFGIGDKNSAMVSRILKDAVSAKLIRVQDDQVGSKAKKYLPAWVD